MIKLKYSFEYFCSPFWIEEVGLNNPIYKNVSVFELSINRYLQDEIEKLDKIYQSSYNDEYPPEPLKFDLFEEIIFVNRVLISYLLLKKEAEGKYELFFNIRYWKNRLFDLKKGL